MIEKNICGERVRRARKAARLGQVDLAAAMEVEHGLKLDQSDISEIERGARAVRDMELKALAAVLDVSAAWLLDEPGAARNESA